MKKYSIIYADPPWSISSTSQIPSGRPGSRPYRAMRMVDIFSMDVRKISEEDSVLFLWATSPLIPEAIHCMKAWGFEYKSVAFTWVKKNKSGKGLFWGMGWWTRSNPEFCLLGVRGNPKRISASVHSVIESPIEAHSKKPKEAYLLIEKLMGDLPRVELFAREKTPGWDSWGNEVENSLEITT